MEFSVLPNSIFGTMTCSVVAAFYPRILVAFRNDVTLATDLVDQRGGCIRNKKFKLFEIFIYKNAIYTNINQLNRSFSKCTVSSSVFG